MPALQSLRYLAICLLTISTAVEKCKWLNGIQKLGFEVTVPWEACLTPVTADDDADLEDVITVVSSPCGSCGTEFGGYTNSWHLLHILAAAIAPLEFYRVYLAFMSLNFNNINSCILSVRLTVHRGLPPCCGGGAYAPMTRTIIYSEGEELTKRRPPDRNNHTTHHQSQVAGDLFGFTADFGLTADYCDLLVTLGLRIGPNWYGLSAGQV